MPEVRTTASSSPRKTSPPDVRTPKIRVLMKPLKSRSWVKNVTKLSKPMNSADERSSG